MKFNIKLGNFVHKLHVIFVSDMWQWERQQQEPSFKDKGPGKAKSRRVKDKKEDKESRHAILQKVRHAIVF